MKKIFTLLAISLVLVLPIVSCSTDDESAKQAEKDRNELEIPDDNNNSQIKHNQLALYVSAKNVPVRTLVSFTTMLNGVDVTNQVTYYVNNISISGNSIASTLNGTFKIQAKLDGYIDSPIATVVYGTGTTPNPEPTGNFIFNGTSYNVVVNILIFNGAFLESGQTVPYSSWSSLVLNNTNPEQANIGAMIDFKTPFTIVDPVEGSGNVVMPNGTNETYWRTPQVVVNQTNLTNQVGTGSVHYPNFGGTNATTNNFTANLNFGANTLLINFNGAFLYIDESEENAPAARNQNQTSFKAKLNVNKTTKTSFIK